MSADGGAGATSPDYLVVGHISKAHGTKGELFVMPLTDSPDIVFAPGSELLLGDDDGAVSEDSSIVTVESVRAFKRGLLVKLETLDDRNGAEPFGGLYFLLPAAAVPPLEEGEVFYHELIGSSVETVDGSPVGSVREVFDTDPHHLLEVVGPDGKARLIPFAERIIRQVDRDARRIVIDPPEGLLEL